MKKRLYFCFIIGAFLLQVNVFSQVDTLKEESKEAYIFSILHEIPRTSVKDQGGTGTCWCFATISFLESELLREMGVEFDLSEMFIVRHAYTPKALNYIRLHGMSNFGQGGQAHDVLDQIREHGIVPEEVYTGMHIGENRHNHGEMASVLQGMLDAILKKRGLKITPKWSEAYEKVLEVYLGESPETFIYNGKTVTPMEFSENVLKWNLNDYIELTSYTHHPFYSTFAIELPDNWSHNDQYYNLPIDDLERIVDFALQNGYSCCWDADVSERGFSKDRNEFAIVPEKDWEDMTREEREAKVTEPVQEKTITQEMRQVTFENFTTTDDHLMHIVGMAQDQTGAPFYLIKNSWGTDRKYEGYQYVSKPYFRLKTIALLINKNALPQDIKKKLKL